MQQWVGPPLTAIWIACLGCGGHAADAGQASKLDQNVSSLAGASPLVAVSASSPKPVATAPQGPAGCGSGQGSEGGASTADPGSVRSDCENFPPFLISDDVSIGFQNDTTDTIYLASTNAHCGAWPAFLEFSQNGAPVDLFVGDCLPNCSRLIESGYLGYQGATGGCGLPSPCPTPFRAIPPGQSIFQIVEPWRDTHSRLSRSCVPDAPNDSIECVNTERLPDGTYSLRATAYRDISCAGGSCSCAIEDMLDWCHGSGGAQQPVSCGAPLHAEATLQLSSSPAVHATLVFSE